MGNIDCGCDTRKDIIGSNAWWSGVTVAAGALALLLTHGGVVTQKTKKILAIALGGAIVAIISDQVVKPVLGVKV